MLSILARLAGYAPKTRYRAAIAAIAKNEGPYLLEWIAFHRVVGIEHFFIADNLSDDGSTELLIALDQAGIITRLGFATVRGRPPQLPAYRKLMKRYGKHADWIAIVDCDEFLTPTGTSRTIEDVLRPIEVNPDIGVIYLNWAMFGSSRTQPANKPVIERFSLRASDEDAVHNLHKPLVRRGAYRRPASNPHSVELRRGFRAVHSDGSEVRPHANGPGFSAKVVYDRMRINHYFAKSEAEFELMKRPKGRADQAENLRPDNHTLESLNRIAEPMPDWLVTATKTEMENLRSKLRGAGCSEEIATLDRRLLERLEGLRSRAGAGDQ